MDLETDRSLLYVIQNLVVLLSVHNKQICRWRAGRANCFIVEKSSRRTAFGTGDSYYLPHFF